MIVVSDTTPLNYLLLIDAVEILPKLFGVVTIPPAVLHELQDAGAPSVVRRWIQKPPAWLHVRAPRVTEPSTSELDPGEAEAIALAKELNATVILMDERKATRIAQNEGLIVVRTLALLELAAERNLLDLPTALRALQATSFRISKELIDAALARGAARTKPDQY